MFFYLPAHIFDCVSEYKPFASKKDIINTPTQTKKQKKIAKERDIQNKPKKKRRKNVVVNSICRKSNDTSEFAVKAVFHLGICL